MNRVMLLSKKAKERLKENLFSRRKSRISKLSENNPMFRFEEISTEIPTEFRNLKWSEYFTFLGTFAMRAWSKQDKLENYIILYQVADAWDQSVAMSLELALENVGFLKYIYSPYSSFQFIEHRKIYFLPNDLSHKVEVAALNQSLIGIHVNKLKTDNDTKDLIYGLSFSIPEDRGWARDFRDNSNSLTIDAPVPFLLDYWLAEALAQGWIIDDELRSDWTALVKFKKGHKTTILSLYANPSGFTKAHLEESAKNYEEVSGYTSFEKRAKRELALNAYFNK